MSDLVGILVLTALLALSAILIFYNSRQARELKEMREVADSWYLLVLREKREARKKEVSLGNPMEWLSEQSGRSLEKVSRVLKNPAAVELSTASGERVVVSPLSPRQLRQALKAVETRRGRLSGYVEPLLTGNPQVIERSIADSGEWFDVEAGQVGAKLGADWGEVVRLFFYVRHERA